MPIAPHFDQVRSWLNEIHREKQAAVKAGKAHSETGSRNGETTHPVKDVDDGLTDARTGARASENEKDIKEMEPTGNVDETKENPGPTQESLNLNIGVHQSATGEDPSVEDNYGIRQSEPGTSHPANMEIGPKYSAWLKKEAKELSGLANDILADIATGVGLNEQPTKRANQQLATKPQAKVDNTTAAQAGYELAAHLGLSKQAADQTVETVVSETIKQAQYGADRVGAYILSFIKESEALIKQSADPTDGSTGEGAPMGDPSAGGAPPGAEAMPPPPPGPEAGGGDPSGGAGGGQEQALQELAMALMELGIDPEQLSQAMAQGGAGGGMGGGAPGGDALAMGGGAGGQPPMPPEGGAAEMGGKIASAVRSFKRSGRFEVRPAKTAAERAQRNEMKKYILEIMGATR